VPSQYVELTRCEHRFFIYNSFFHTKLAGVKAVKMYYEEMKRCVFMHSVSCDVLPTDDTSVRRYMRKKKLDEMDIIMFPINVGNMHWQLQVVYCPQKQIM